MPIFNDPEGEAYGNAATGVRGWITPTSIRARGVPEQVAPPPSKLEEIDSEVSYWNEPAQQPVSPRFEELMDAASKEVSRAFSRMSGSSLKETRAEIDRIIGKYAYDAPEISGALKQMVRDKLPSKAAGELSGMQAAKKLREEMRLKGELQAEQLRQTPGYFTDASGKLVPMAETPAQKREAARQEKIAQMQAERDYELEQAKSEQQRNPYLAFFNIGTPGQPKLFGVDMSKNGARTIISEKKLNDVVLPPMRDYAAEQKQKKEGESFWGRITGGAAATPAPAPAAPAAPAATSGDTDQDGIEDIDEQRMRWAKENAKTDPLLSKQIIDKLKRKYPRSF